MKFPALRFATLAAFVLVAVPPRSVADDEQSGSKTETVAKDTDSTLRPGSRVRVTAASPAFTGSLVGTLISRSAQELIILDPKTGAVSELPADSVRRVEVSRRGSHARRGLLIGLAVGALTALAISADDSLTCNGYGEPSRPCRDSEKALYAAFAFGLYGGTGAWIGSRVKTDSWSDAPLGRARLSLRPGRSGARADLTLSF